MLSQRLNRVGVSRCSISTAPRSREATLAISSRRSAHSGRTKRWDAAELIAMGITGRRTTVPLSPEMQDAVCIALDGKPPDALAEALRTKVRRKILLIKEW